jgi:hypothetical protein
LHQRQLGDPQRRRQQRRSVREQVARRNGNPKGQDPRAAQAARRPRQGEKAERELPDTVDTERDKGILDRLGIDPQDLMGNLGGLGDKLGL